MALSNSAGLADHIIAAIDTIWSWDDHFRVLGALNADLRALSGEDWSRCMRRLARQHKLMKKRHLATIPNRWGPANV